MTMLTDHVDVVIGVDTHKDTHTAAIVDRFGGVLEVFEFPANRAGYRSALARVTSSEATPVWGV